MIGEENPFHRYHRRERVSLFLRRAPVIAILIGTMTLLGWAVVTAPPPVPSSAVALATVEEPGTLIAPAPDEAPVDPANPPGTSAPIAPPATVAQPEVDDAQSGQAPPDEVPTDEALTETGPPEGGWEIDISLAGHQAEVDQCVWVRMDLAAVAPIVGAHNNCGGDIVLDMAVGDTVQLTGFDLGGEYVVTGDRDAFAGDIASEATEGMVADVVLQTCYYSTDGRERLVSLSRVA